jgi:hypothetical protein
VDTSNLDVVFVSNFMELGLICFGSKIWKLDVNRSSHSGTQVGRARGDVTKMRVMGKFSDLFDSSSTSSKSSEYFTNVSTFFHGNDPELILFVDPYKESFVLVVINSSSRRPVSIETTCIKESITLLEKEMVGN